VIVVETNLLVFAYDSQAPRHAEARLWWEAALSGVVHSDDRDFSRFAGLRWRNPLG